MIWELEHRIGSTARNVAYSPVTPYTYANTAVECSPKMWYNSLDHIFDHNEHFLLIQYPGVAQLIERAVWDREAAGLSPATWTTKVRNR